MWRWVAPATGPGRLLERLVLARPACGNTLGETENPSLRALTAAALALPGLATQAAEGDGVGMQYGAYKQSQFQLADGLKTQYNPLQVSNLSANGGFTFSDRWKFIFNYVQDTWSGATPVASAPVALGGNNPTEAGASPLIRGNGGLFYSRNYTPYQQTFDPETGEERYTPDNRLQQTIASASPETRDQGDFRIGYEWDEAAIDFGGGVSNERDYHSSFVSLNGRFDFAQKLTTLNFGLSYNNSDISAILNPASFPYYDSSFYANQIVTKPGPYDSVIRILTGTRDDWSGHLGLVQVLDKDALIEASMGYVRSTGYLGNPYKLVDFVFVDTSQAPIVVPGTPPLWQAQVEGVLERRPGVRNQGIWNLRYVQFFERFDAAAHLGFRFFHDDWGINAYNFDADWNQPLGDGWMITPRFRYYSQDAADFYQPYFLFKQAVPTSANGTFNLSAVPLDAYSSDYRLGAFGAVSGGVVLSKQIGKALGFEAAFEYYSRANSLTLGGSGSGAFADFNYYQFSAGVKVDLSAASQAMVALPGHEHHHHGAHHEAHAPAGVLFGHTLEKKGDLMVGYRFSYSLQDGAMLHGGGRISDAAIVAHGCGAEPCSYTPRRMGMNMHMLDLMYAPTDWLTLMLMPQFMTMDMTLRPLEGGVPPPSDGGHNHGGSLEHSTGGVGDIGIYGLVKLYDDHRHHLHGTLGFSAPTGSVDLRLNGNSTYDHYGMQLGSGTWDFRPSLTYQGKDGEWFWGGQLNGIVSMQARNESGYALGDLFQTTAWGGYQILNWLSATLRGIYTLQGTVSGRFDPPILASGPMDLPGNYGGRYWDLGFGLNAFVPEGSFAGNQFGIEWLQPVHDDPNGYQLERTGTLYATWGLQF